MQLHKLTIVFASLLAACLLAVACGDDDADDVEENTGTPGAVAETFFDCAGDYPGTPPDASDFPIQALDGTGEPVTISAPPQAIASLSAAATEILYAIGAGDQVSAIDNTSNCPVQAQSVEALVDAFNPSVEAITALNPDLVIVFYDPGDLISSLRTAGLTVLYLESPPTIAGVYAHVRLLGQVTGHAREANAFADAMREEITAVTGALPGGDGPSVYHELDSQYFSAASGSFIGDFYDTLGAQNIANTTGEPYPQLSAEAIIAADPDVIILADEGLGETADTVAARPGWDAITAVQEEQIYGIDPDIVSRPGPRVVDAIRILADYLYGTEFSH